MNGTDQMDQAGIKRESRTRESPSHLLSRGSLVTRNRLRESPVEDYGGLAERQLESIKHILVKLPYSQLDRRFGTAASSLRVVA